MTKQRKIHRPADFKLDVMSGDADLFKWFLLCYLFGKPIRAEAAINTWRIFINQQLDTPWSILAASEPSLIKNLQAGGYRRYQHVTAEGLVKCLDRLVREYEGSLLFMIESSLDEDEFAKRLQQLHGVGPRVTEIFMRETKEYFARRVE